MADLSTAFKGGPAGQHTDTEQFLNRLDAEIHNDIEDAIVLVNTDVMSLIEQMRAMEKAFIFKPSFYMTLSTVPVIVTVVAALSGGTKNPFSISNLVSVEIVADTTGGALLNGVPGPALISLSEGLGTVQVIAPGPGLVTLGLVDSGGYGLDTDSLAYVYVDTIPPIPTPTNPNIYNMDGELAKVLLDIDGNGLGLIEVLKGGLSIGERRKLDFTGAGVSSIVTSNGKVVVTIPGGGAAIQDEIFYVNPAVQVLDMVYIDSSDHVDRTDASAEITMPSIGFAVSDLGGGQMEIRYVGKVSGFIAKYPPSGLTPGELYYADPAVPGGIVIPSPSGPPGSVAQEIGRAKNADELMLFIDQDYVIL